MYVTTHKQMELIKMVNDFEFLTFINELTSWLRML